MNIVSKGGFDSDLSLNLFISFVSVISKFYDCNLKYHNLYFLLCINNSNHCCSLLSFSNESNRYEVNYQVRMYRFPFGSLIHSVGSFDVYSSKKPPQIQYFSIFCYKNLFEHFCQWLNMKLFHSAGQPARFQFLRNLHEMFVRKCFTQGLY